MGEKEWVQSPYRPGGNYFICPTCYAEVHRSDVTKHSGKHETKVARGALSGASGSCECADCGATVANDRWDKHSKWHRSIREGMDMSRVAWCDYGDHPFKRGVQGSASFSGTVNTKDGQQVQEMDACPQHNPMRAEPENVRKELEAAYPVPEDGENLSGH